MGIIHVLDTHVANQIAAGEVIERPSSAVKELVENALDAHAENITVEIENGGVDLIKITDDGDGFYKEDLPLAICRHATSKIVHFNDVYRLNTFGFRGEALASIAVISRLRITSGQDNQSPANVLTSDANGKTDLTIAPPRKGSCIEVRDLYYNVPARKKFVKTNSHESALIYDLICKLALGFPSVNFTFINNGDVVFSSNQLNTVEHILQSIYKDAPIGEIIHIQEPSFYQKQGVEAWFLPPAVTRKNRSHITLFVNDRLIESHELEAIIDEATYTLIPKGRFPVCVLKLSLPAFNIDVNIHPSKKRIKFKNIDEWKGALVTLIKENLWLSRLNVPYQISTDAAPANGFSLRPETISTPISTQQLDFSVSEKPTFADEKNRPSINENKGFAVAEETVEYHCPEKATVMKKECLEHPPFSQKAQQANPALPSKAVSATPQTALTKSSLGQLEYIGQLNQTFLLAQDRNNLYIIDQHTLHERILYERFMKESVDRANFSQPLLHPVSLKVTPLQEEALISYIVTLRQLGFILEKKGPLYFEVTALPSFLVQEENIHQFINDLLDELLANESLSNFANINEDRIITAACKAAVKAHYKLSEQEVRQLLVDLSALENAHTCPHGRPIIMNISMNDIYLFFKRGSF